MSYRLLDEFRKLFDGKRYLHRNSTLGDFVAMHLFEDLYSIGRSHLFSERVNSQRCVLNTANKRRGVAARRGDGIFGEIIPNEEAIRDSGYAVSRGAIATIEIGCEVKILAKAMIKQIDRVIGDLVKQVGQFRKGSGAPICAGIVGVNHAESYVGYERDREWPTDGTSGYRHPIQEASEAESRLVQQAKPSFDEFIILRFRATNRPPYTFEWVDLRETELDYGAILTRIANEYTRRFRDGHGSHE